MKRQLRSISTVVVLMFVALFVSTTSIQFFSAQQLRADSRNSRTILDSYSTKRGAILVDGTPIAESKPVDDQYNYQRTYANGDLYSAVTGYFTIGQGETGVESAENSYLAGTSSDSFFSNINSILTGQDVQGDDVNLTIDPQVQQAAFDALGSNTGAVVAIEPKTGKILAMVSKASFDPNTLAVHDTKQVLAQYHALLSAESQPLQNRAIAGDLYAPGSTFKLIVASAAFASGDYDLDSTLPNPSTLTLPGTSRTINNAEGGSCGGGNTVTIAVAIQNSCNIPFAELGQKLGYDAINAMAKQYGFGDSIHVPMASTPSQYPQTDGTAELMRSAFGQQSVRVTPLQMAMVSAGIANGGRVMSPTLIDKITTSDLKTVVPFQAKQYGDPISSDVASDLTKAMESVVDNGTGTNARIDGVDVAGKTGTAENGTGDPYTLWFTGFAPAKDPQVAVAVVVGNGGGLGQQGVGNTVAAPIAKKVMEAVLNK
ncbi:MULTISPECIES: penicillin-binding protein 2 [unclassified Curtobacterium]|uniref:peptidoglycan D,D-transpeptidase FtsI family protein n=1 Tax=unclassified Curtobacterium TaxID=257496 RepID=UPI000DA9CBBA|nr:MULTISPECIES: penicillin-binding protein 2 [unclassified Curtobacterium]PZE26010.1 penicillin-binding protein 2 [Curtobacterium sp. MCBD17_028]PZE77786.1 penicillin-binding protein 2 [Curtobacterium sp. MCBD17_019]PZF62003.1 penicillin-binding protein 2 [Curtobacterium sp. MCBD17_034]PZM34063.1 penicillin-binding protein 2 [Curtobacterium sp. MCBD17_031]WIB67473.1 penicillin-binding protein 2 [Curtobacterium sp. MCBD17_035]